MLGIPVDDTVILKEPIRLWQAFWLLCGFWVLNYLTDMIYYEIKYYNGAGDDFLLKGKRYVMRLRIMRKKYNDMRYYHELKKYFHNDND